MIDETESAEERALSRVVDAMRMARGPAAPWVTGYFTRDASHDDVRSLWHALLNLEPWRAAKVVLPEHCRIEERPDDGAVARMAKAAVAEMRGVFAEERAAHPLRFWRAGESQPLTEAEMWARIDAAESALRGYLVEENDG